MRATEEEGLSVIFYSCLYSIVSLSFKAIDSVLFPGLLLSTITTLVVQQRGEIELKAIRKDRGIGNHNATALMQPQIMGNLMHTGSKDAGQQTTVFEENRNWERRLATRQTSFR